MYLVVSLLFLHINDKMVDCVGNVMARGDAREEK
jgi:hypothetical protein